MAHGAPGFFGPAGRPLLRPSLRTVAIGGGATAAAAAGAVGWHHCQRRQQQQHSEQQQQPWRPPRLVLSATAIEAIAGAMGEVAQICILYPLDTIKVRCQAQGVPARAVVSSFAKMGLTAAASQLFAGVGQAAVASVLVGAVHFMSFCWAKRQVSNHLESSSNAATAAASSSGGGGVSGGSQSHQPQRGEDGHHQRHHHMIVSHGASGSHFTPIDLDTPEPHDVSPGGVPGAAAAAAGGSAGAASAAGSGGGSSGGGGHHGGGGSNAMAANLTAAVVAAVATALVEAPLELFRHNAQAGTCAAGGDFLREMWRVARKAGSPLPLYRGLTAYSLEAIPYDVSELVVVGNLNDARVAAEAAEAAGRGRGGPLAAAAAAVPQPLWDVAVGAAAGAAAVIVSMPFDVVKTYMQTHPACGGGLRGFADTARLLVARGGAGALWLGLAPRLAHQVPGACICWAAIHSVQRHMMEHHHEGGSGGGGGGGGGLVEGTSAGPVYHQH